MFEFYNRPVLEIVYVHTHTLSLSLSLSAYISWLHQELYNSLTEHKRKAELTKMLRIFFKHVYSC